MGGPFVQGGCAVTEAHRHGAGESRSSRVRAVPPDRSDGAYGVTVDTGGQIREFPTTRRNAYTVEPGSNSEEALDPQASSTVKLEQEADHADHTQQHRDDAGAE